MRKEPFKVNEQEFKLVQQIRNLKQKGFTDEDILQLDRNKETGKEEKQKNRLDTLALNKLRITQWSRAVEHKNNQISNRKSLEVDEKYLDKTKPIFIIENEVDEINAQLEKTKELNKVIQEEYDKDEQKT